MQDHVDTFRETGDGFVHAVVDHFLGQVVRALCVRVHARSPADRVKSL